MERSLIGLSNLAVWRNPDGGKINITLAQLLKISFLHLANYIFISLNFATSGPLQGKYVLFHIKLNVRDYVKKCSSVLGLSAIVTKMAELLISDNLSPDVLISNNPYEAFKKGCTTICKGIFIGV